LVDIDSHQEAIKKEVSMNGVEESINPKQVVERGYDQVAHEYARLEIDTEWPRMRWLKKVLNYLPPGSSILDLGCGSGVPADTEIAKEHRITGVDISQTQINLARQNIPTGTFFHADAGSVEFSASSFDAVISFYTLEHIPRKEHETILQRIYQWLRPGGLLLISMEEGDYEGFFGEWLGVPMYMSCFDPETMKQMINRVGFELLESVIETQVEQGHEIPYHWLLARK
jgi:ubiquinone/menaquinone biosynthesis C-methylase UbiE